MSRFIPQTCPGISKFIRPIPEYITCPACRGDVEIWSDEDEGVCTSCGKKTSRSESIQSCLDWCPQADKCREVIASTRG